MAARRVPDWAQATFYGRVMLLKATCPVCGSYSIILDGKSACCDASLEVPERYKTKREGEGEKHRGYIPRRIREAIIAGQGNRCIYCQQRLDGVAFNRKRNKAVPIRIHIDHLVCWKYSQDNGFDNLLAACHICNGIKNDYLFENFYELQRFILGRRAAKGWVDESADDSIKEKLSKLTDALGQIKISGRG